MPLYLKVLVPKRVSLQLPDKSWVIFLYKSNVFRFKCIDIKPKIMTAFFNVCEDQKKTYDNYYVLFLCDLPIPIRIKNWIAVCQRTQSLFFGILVALLMYKLLNI